MRYPSSKPPRLPKLWRKKNKKGQYVGNYITKIKNVDINLGTQILDGPDGALERQKHALNGKRNFNSDADRVADAMERAPAPAMLAPPPPAAPPPPDPPQAAAAAPPAPAPIAVTPDAVIPPPPRLLPAIGAEAAEEAAATAAAAAETADQGAAADGAANGAGPTEEVDLDELAELAVQAQVWAAAEYARTKVYRGFETPKLPDEATKQLAAQWKKIASYSGMQALMPPWVTGLVIPGAILVTSTFAMARAFADAARAQKAAPGANAAAAAGAAEPLREAA